MRIAALISGGGTTMQRVIQACQSGQLAHAEVVCVIASRPDAGGLDKALAQGLSPADVMVRRPRAYASADQFGEALLQEFTSRGVDFIAQLGWLPLTPAVVVEAYPTMMGNQHPGPLRPDHRDFGGPGMYGRRVHAARLSFIRQTGRNYWTEVVCHRVVPAVDCGAITKLRRVEVNPDDDTAALQQRALPVEHEVQIEALDDYSQNRVQELRPIDNLVLPGEEPILDLAKKSAIHLWPKG
jgi:phosphoribosylglycinamide formyltransferase 1